MFRFLIVPVVIDLQGMVFAYAQEPVIIQAPNYNSAAAEAESRWPNHNQISVTKIGRVLDASAANKLPMASG